MTIGGTLAFNIYNNEMFLDYIEYIFSTKWSFSIFFNFQPNATYSIGDKIFNTDHCEDFDCAIVMIQNIYKEKPRLERRNSTVNLVRLRLCCFVNFMFRGLDITQTSFETLKRRRVLTGSKHTQNDSFFPDTQPHKIKSST